MSLNMLMQALSQGLLFGIMGLGVYITFRFLNFADLTVEGSFTLGAAVTARLIVSDVDPFLAVFIAIGAGLLAGLATGIFHTVLRIPPLLSGILTMTGLYSINLRIMGRANIPILWDRETILTRMAGMMGDFMAWFRGVESYNVTNRDASVFLGIIFVTVILVILRLFFNTELGCAIRATGDNEAMSKAQGINTNRMKVLGLMLGNACVAMSGALVMQAQGFADISMGVGIIVFGLAAVIIGEVIFSDKNRHWVLLAVVLGSILHRIIISFVLRFGINPNDFRLFTALMIAVALSLPLFREKFNIHVRKLFWGGK
jgi:putative ABC transport system permease protein